MNLIYLVYQIDNPSRFALSYKGTFTQKQAAQDAIEAYTAGVYTIVECYKK